MEKTNVYDAIPLEKFVFAQTEDISHDKKPETKPVGYLEDALRRFAKNKGAIVAAIVIFIMVLFAIFVPFFTQYQVSYFDTYFSYTQPKCSLFENTSFWDGCKELQTNLKTFTYYYAMGQETGHNAVKNQEYTLTEDGEYHFRLDTYHMNGVVYKNLSMEEYYALQEHQNETGIQVIYPMVAKRDRPTSVDYEADGNIYYKTEAKGGKTQIVYDDDGNIIPVYNSYPASIMENGIGLDQYNSLRVEGEEGFLEDEQTCYYSYALVTPSGVQVRVNYYEYYTFYHSEILNDGIGNPSFLFGTTGTGKDILTCLSSGARFSFIFAIIVAVSNLIVGAIYGSIAGYYGGRLDLVMERITDILGAVPTMIVITLLKLHMGTASQALALFITFFLLGWIGMGRRTRMQFYRFKNQEYVLSARTLGASDKRLMFKHIFPNAIGTLVTDFALVIPFMIYSETSLSYLGIINLATGNITSVGTLIAAGQASLATAPFVAMFPSIFLALLMLSFNLFGNGLRDAFNPSLRGTEG